MLWQISFENIFAKKVIFVAFLMAFVAACAPLQTTHSTLHQGDINTADCDSLIQLFSNNNEAFETLSFNPSVKRKVTLWESNYQLMNNRCQIWQWADKYSYACNKIYPDQESAHQSYEQIQAHINQCLGKNPQSWYEQQEFLQGREEETRYLLNKEERGFLKKIKINGLLKDNWSVYFLINSPIKH